MKIVIDIDNETYGRIQALVNADYFEHDICGYSMQRIANGTPYEARPTGEWIEETDEHLKGMYRCSKCGRRVDGSVLDDLLMVDEDYTIADIYHYCHCGADMRGKEKKNE